MAQLVFDLFCWSATAIVAGVLLQWVINSGIIVKPAIAGSPTAGPLVSILIPARNESLRLGPCLESLLRQNYRNCEILVLDDQSEDGTAEVAMRYGFLREPQARRRLLSGTPLPAGWTGKAWACHQLSREAEGEYLLFTDADTQHAPATVGAVVRHAQKTKADLLTLWPYQVTGTFAEMLVIPLLFVAAGSFIPHWILSWSQNSMRVARFIPRGQLRGIGAANGQFLFFRKTSYEKIGGHRAVANHLVEDVALGRNVAERTADGLRLISCDGSDLVRCRMYSSLSEMWEGFTKNIRPLFDQPASIFAATMLGQFAVFVLPFLLLPFAGSSMLWLLASLILLLRASTAFRFRNSFWTVVFHPLGYGLALLIAFNSLRRAGGQGVTWKGRLYRL